jgi:alpha-galactosidase
MKKRDHNLLKIVVGLWMGMTTLCFAQTNMVWLDEMDLTQMRQGYGKPQTNASVSGGPISLASRKFERGVGTHARSTLWIETAGAKTFSASVGVSDTCGGPGTAVFRVLGDGKELFNSGVMKPKQVKQVNVDVSRTKSLLLTAGDAGDGVDFDHAIWADAKFTYEGTPPQSIAPPVEKAEILTPKPKPAPRINGPTIYGCRPGNPFLYRIPAQGERPMQFSAKNLPATLKLDSATGIISGEAPLQGVHAVTLTAKNEHGSATRLFRIQSGDKLSLTPSMGWNHWYAHYNRVTDQMMREAADILLSSGMADVGYDYVNIDDCWMNAPKHQDPLRVGSLRDENGRIIPNKHFPDMKGLADYIHSKGLKAGLYTSPGPTTCAGFAGAWQHEAIDAATFAEWGYDFLKYDWCSYNNVAAGKVPGSEKVPNFSQENVSVLEVHMYPYRLMGDLLKNQKRDIVYNLCQYGMQNVWEWGADVSGHSWRTAGDLGFALDRVFDVALRNAEHRAWSRPGNWNDPDYIQIGWIGKARGGGLPEPTTMRPNEQYSYMSLWALMASPIFYSGDMTRLDEFTLNILCNPEVIEINQDALGQSAAIARLNEDGFVFVKDLEDGSKAIGIFNTGEFPAELNLPWAAAGLREPRILRDVWRQLDIGAFAGDHRFQVPARGCLLLTAREKK